MSGSTSTPQDIPSASGWPSNRVSPRFGAGEAVAGSGQVDLVRLTDEIDTEAVVRLLVREHEPPAEVQDTPHAFAFHRSDPAGLPQCSANTNIMSC